MFYVLTGQTEAERRSIAGYGFEVYHDKAKDKLFSILLLAMMVPQVAMMILPFRMFSKAKLLNTSIGFILPMIVFFVLQKQFAEGITGAVK